MGKREWGLVSLGAGTGAGAAVVLQHLGGEHALRGAGWLGGIALLWMSWLALYRLRDVLNALDDARRVVAATSTAALKTSERLTNTRDEIKTMRTELGSKITAAGERAAQQHERAAVDRVIAATKQRQADYDEQQTGRLVDVQQTLAAMSVRLLTMANKQDAVVATLQSLPYAHADETTLPAQGNEPTAPELPPSGVQHSSVQPSERTDESAADDDDDTTLFGRADLTPSPSQPSPAADKPLQQSTGAWLAARAMARLKRAQLQRAQEQKRDDEGAEPPSSNA